MAIIATLATFLNIIQKSYIILFTILCPYNYILEFLDLNGERTRERILLEHACLVDTGSKEIRLW